MLLCLASFIRLLAPAIGYSMASFFVKFYVAPELHPTITVDDPRWVGAWWIGYVIFATAMCIFATIICTFPKILPRAALRRKQEILKKMEKNSSDMIKDSKSSIAG